MVAVLRKVMLNGRYHEIIVGENSRFRWASFTFSDSVTKLHSVCTHNSIVNLHNSANLNRKNAKKTVDWVLLVDYLDRRRKEDISVYIELCLKTL